MKIELLKPHTHAGRDYLPGAVIDLDKDAAEWLIASGIAKPATKPSKPSEV
ncbi:MAG: hypothetical protein Q8O38_01715 [Sulfurimicrobium sp.]|nr:hypothetical protein [Sulfurimicrobium sp.]